MYTTSVLQQRARAVADARFDSERALRDADEAVPPVAVRSGTLLEIT